MGYTEPDGITVHPFGDEWLWADGGKVPMEFDSIEAAAAYANDYRKDYRKSAANADASDPTVQLAESMWFAIEDEEHADTMALVAPDGTTITDEDEITRLKARIGSDGAWPGAEADQPRWGVTLMAETNAPDAERALAAVLEALERPGVAANLEASGVFVRRTDLTARDDVERIS